MTAAPFLLASGEGRVAHAVSEDGGGTWSSAPVDVLAAAPVRKLVVGIDRRADEVWISTARNQMLGSTCGLPPSPLDLDVHLGSGVPAPGADIAVILHLRDPPLAPGQLSYPVAFRDGRPVDPAGLEPELEIECPFFVGMKLLLTGLSLREVANKVRMRGDLLASSVFVGAVARIDVLESHRWCKGALAVAEQTRTAWESAALELVTAKRGEELGRR